MADDDETPPPKEVHVGLTRAELEEAEQRIENKIRALHDDHTRESAAKIKDLETELKELKDEAAERKTAEANKEKASSDGNTLVVPAAKAEQVQTHEEQEQHKPASEHEPEKQGKKKLRWW